MQDLSALKGQRKIVMLTCYDFQHAKLLEEAGIDLLLVGDSLGMVVLGYADTKNVTLEEMLHHTRAVARGAKKTHIVGDMPINTYNTPEEAVKNAKKFIEAGAHSVKVEGLKEEVVKALIENKIPVMGHLGLLPQTAEKYCVQGKTEEEAERIFQEALALDKLGIYSLVLECVPQALAQKITQAVKCPTIGIGASKDCDGQVLVLNDILGLDAAFDPKFVKRYAQLSPAISEAVKKFKKEVIEEKFPAEEHTFH
jgi:3-methyl-2-oxobutanoate hydroxymethyltransferase